MIKLSHDNFHRQWQLSYTGIEGKRFVDFCRMTDQVWDNQPRIFWQGSSTQWDMNFCHDNKNQESWQMFEFWTSDEGIILEFSMQIAELMGVELQVV